MNNKKWFLASLLLLNAVPLYGVLAWGWQSFDLIFLYWLENVIIGVFAILRFLVRPNWQEKEKRRAFFTVPFFVIHYGLFCFAHGTLVMNLFGDSVLGQIAEQSIPTVIPVVLEMRNLWWAVIALAVLQLLDWIRDARQREDDEQVSQSDAVRVDGGSLRTNHRDALCAYPVRPGSLEPGRTGRRTGCVRSCKDGLRYPVLAKGRRTGEKVAGRRGARPFEVRGRQDA